MVAQGCRVQQAVLTAEFKDFYELYPKYKPKEKPKPSKSGGRIDCIEKRFENCSATIFEFRTKIEKRLNGKKCHEHQRKKDDENLQINNL